MRFLSRLLTVLLCLIMAGSAAAEVHFIPTAGEWDLESMPVEVNVSAAVLTHMPFSDERVKQLTAITDRLALRLHWQPLAGEIQSRAALLLDGEELISFAQQQTENETMLQLSALPDTTYSAASAPLDVLLGQSSQATELWGLTGTEHEWLEQGYELLMNLEAALEPYLDAEKSVKTAIENMGRAAVCQDYTVKSADAAVLTELLSGACPDGRLKELVSSLIFSGKQTLRVYRTSEGVPLRMEYNGNCGKSEDTLRDVNLVWRLRRDDEAYRDEVTLKSPALKGSDRNTISWNCAVTKTKKGALNLDCSLEYTVVKDKVKTTLDAEIDLKNELSGEDSHITGDVEIKQKIDDESWNKLIFEPNLTIYGAAGSPYVDGTVNVKGQTGSNTTEEALLTLSLARAGYMSWEMRENTVDLSLMDEAALSSAKQEVSQAVAATVICGLIRAMGTEATYLFQDIPEETVLRLIDAAQK